MSGDRPRQERGRGRRGRLAAGACLVLLWIVPSLAEADSRPVLVIWHVPTEGLLQLLEPWRAPSRQLYHDLRTVSGFYAHLNRHYRIAWIDYRCHPREAAERGILKLPAFEVRLTPGEHQGIVNGYRGPAALLRQLAELPSQPPAAAPGGVRPELPLQGSNGTGAAAPSQPPAAAPGGVRPELPLQGSNGTGAAAPSQPPAAAGGGHLETESDRDRERERVVPSEPTADPSAAHPSLKDELAGLRDRIRADNEQERRTILEALERSFERLPRPQPPGESMPPPPDGVRPELPLQGANGTGASAPSQPPAAAPPLPRQELRRSGPLGGDWSALFGLAAIFAGGAGTAGIPAWLAIRSIRRVVERSSSGAAAPGHEQPPSECGGLAGGGAEPAAPFPRELDEARELLQLRQSEGRVPVLDALRGMFLDDESDKILQGEDAEARRVIHELRGAIDGRVDEVAPLSARYE